MTQWIFDFHDLYAIKIEIQTKSGFEYFTACTMNLEYMKVSKFELYYGRKWTFTQYSNFLTWICTSSQRRSAIFEKNRENVCKLLNILTRFYERLPNPRSAVFEKNVNICSNLSNLQSKIWNSNICFWGVPGTIVLFRSCHHSVWKWEFFL